MSWMQDVMDAKKRGWNPPEDGSMTKRYIDLAGQVFAETNAAHLADVKEVLRWLDENPADLPERTITEARMIQACDNLMKSEAVGDYVGGTRRLAIELGFTVVPDPEPTLLPSTPGASVKMRNANWVRSSTGAWISTDGSILDQDGVQEIANDYGFEVTCDGAKAGGE